MKKQKLVWNVLFHDFNRNEIEDYNIFEHPGFYKDLQKFNKEVAGNDEFFKKVLSALRYYFWAKCEYEILVSGLFDDKQSVKIDIYGQIVGNEIAFKEYLISHRKDI